MPEKGNPTRRITDPSIVERSVILALLDEDRTERWTRAELGREHHDVDPQALTDAIERLEDGEAAHTEGEHIWASRCARHLGSLGVICA